MITRRGRSRMLATGVALSASLLSIATIAASPSGARALDDAELPQLPPAGALFTDGPVDEILGSGGKAYLRGEFRHAGRYSGPSVLLDPGSGAPDPTSARLDGWVSDAVPDGAGGFYAGGTFTQAADVAHANVVHIRADGTVDNAFAASTDGPVNAVALAGGRLYLGGDFTTVGGQPHTRLAVVDTTTGAPLPFAGGSPRRVTELLLDGSRLFVGSLNGPLQALQAATGADVPGFATVPQAVRALAVRGQRLYVGGPAGVVALNADSGNVDQAFRSGLASSAEVQALLVDGPLLLVGGALSDDSSVAALYATTGTVYTGFASRLRPTPVPTGFIAGPGRPDTEGDIGVFDIVRSGDAYWVGGRFDAPGGSDRANLAVVDATTGASRDVTTPYVDGQVNALALAPGGRLFAGGNFRMAGGRAVTSLLKADPTTLAVDPVFGSAAPHDLGDRFGDFFATPTRLFVRRTGGAIPDLDEVPRFVASTDTIISADRRTGEMRRWSTAVRNLTGFVAYGRTDVLIARRLENRPGFPRNVIEQRDAATGRIRRSFPVPLRGYVQSLTIVRDGSLFVSGSFRRKRPNGQQANLALLRMNPRTGRMYNGFDPHAHGPIGSVTEYPDGALEIVGDFTKIQHVRQKYDATIDGRNGFLLRHRRDGGPDLPFQTTSVAGRLIHIDSAYGVATGGEDEGELDWVEPGPSVP